MEIRDIFLVAATIIMFVSIIVILIGSKKGNNRFSTRIDINHINENSFQNYAKFYGEIYPHEEEFDTKLNTIYTLINNNGERDIIKIAESSSCQIPECVIKINYLKNKRLINNLYIDTNNLKLISCSEEDQKLIDKYKPYIYGSHTQIADFASQLPNPDNLTAEELRKKALEELIYLNKKNLINGIKIDDIDGIITYYTLEKRKTVNNMETVHCKNCGALNDVEITGKTRCSYCKSIVIGSGCNE